MTLITHADGTTAPDLWMEYAATQTATTQVHQLMSGAVSVAYGPTTPRRARLALLYTDEAASAAGVALHRKTGAFVITEAGRSSVGMRYVVAGDITRTLDPETQEVWIVTVDVQEVPL